LLALLCHIGTKCAVTARFGSAVGATFGNWLGTVWELSGILENAAKVLQKCNNGATKTTMCYKSATKVRGNRALCLHFCVTSAQNAR